MGLFSNLFKFNWNFASIFSPPPVQKLSVSANPYGGSDWLDAHGQMADAIVDLGNHTYRTTSSDSGSLNSSVRNVITGVANDKITGDGFGNVIKSQAGNDYIDAGAGNDTLDGGEGNDTLIGGTGADSMTGGSGNDLYYVDSSSDTVIEAQDQGYDTVLITSDFTLGSGQSVEMLRASNQNSTVGQSIQGNAYQQTIVGTAGNDRLDSGGGGDILQGGKGDDTYVVRASSDQVVEITNEGKDTVIVETGRYELSAQAAVEVLQAGETGKIEIIGNAFAQTIIGNAYDNVLDGGAGNDTLIGGGKSGFDAMIGKDVDVFRFSTALGEDNIDKIVDFQLSKTDEWTPYVSNFLTQNFQGAGAAIKLFCSLVLPVVFDVVTSALGTAAKSDQISLSKSIFTEIDNGVLNTDAFCDLNTTTETADHRILYDKGTGSIFYDADGSGSIAAIKFAEVQSGLALTASHFVVYA